MMNWLEGQCVTMATAATKRHIKQTYYSQRLELNQQNALSWKSHYPKGSTIGLIYWYLRILKLLKITKVLASILMLLWCVLEVKIGNKGNKRIPPTAPQSSKQISAARSFSLPRTGIFDLSEQPATDVTTHHPMPELNCELLCPN